MVSTRYRNFTPLLIFSLLALAGFVSALLLLDSVRQSQEELLRLRVALAYMEARSRDEQGATLAAGEWFKTAEALVPASPAAKGLLAGDVSAGQASRAEIAAATAWIDRYRERNGRAMTLLMSLLMVTSVFLAFLLYRTGRLVSAVLGERGQALELAGRFSQARERERIRTARELDNGVARALTQVSLRLRDGKAAAEQQAGLATEIEEALTRVRYLIYRMREPDRLGDDILGMVRELCEHFQRETGIETVCEDGTIERRWFGREMALHLYRILQELLINAAQHSRAQTVKIKLEEAGGRLRLLYRDDGVGIPGAAVRGTMGTGLSNMRDRAVLLGGSLTIQAESGTEIEILIPLSSD